MFRKRLWKKLEFLKNLVIPAVGVWFEKRVLHTITPLGMIAVVVLMLDKAILTLGVAPEWSFAAVVLFDAAVGKFTYLKDKPLSVPVSFGAAVSFLRLGRTFSIIIFTLAFLNEQGVQVVLHAHLLFGAQLALFLLSVAASFSAELLDIAGREEGDKLPEWISKHRYFSHLQAALAEACRGLLYASYAIKRKNELNLFTEGGFSASEEWDKRRLDEIEENLAKIENSIDSIRHSIEKQRRETGQERSLTLSEPGAGRNGFTGATERPCSELPDELRYDTNPRESN